MENFKINLSENDIEKIVFAVLDPNKFWIKSVERKFHDEIKGAKIVIASIENPESEIQINFSAYSMVISGCEDDFKKNFQDVYQKFLQDSLSNVVDGMLKTQIDVYSKAGHCTEIVMSNRWWYPGRKIKIGDVFWADLDPVVAHEYGGKRPVVILAKRDSNYLCVPLTTTPASDKILVGIVEGEKESYAVKIVKLVSEERLQKRVCQLDQETYSKVFEMAEEYLKIEKNIELDSEAKREGSLAPAEVSPAIASRTEKTQKAEEKAKAQELIPEEDAERGINDAFVYPTREEYLEIISKYIEKLQKSKHKISFERDNDVLKFVEIQWDTHTEYVLNDTIRKKGFPRTSITFSDSSVRCYIEKAPQNAAELRNEYLRLMFKKNPNYFKFYARNMVERAHSQYDRNLSIKEKLKIAEKEVEFLRERFESVGLVYAGDYSALVHYGVNALNFSLLSCVNDSEDDYENE